MVTTLNTVIRKHTRNFNEIRNTSDSDNQRRCSRFRVSTYALRLLGISEKKMY